MADAIITPEFTPCEGCDEPEACEIVSRCLDLQLDMRAEFEAWVRDRGCDTDGAWSAWQACWNLLTAGVRPVTAQSARGVMQMALNALEAAQAGLEWYRDRCPNEVNGSDDEADEQIGGAMGALVGAIGTKEDQRG